MKKSQVSMYIIIGAVVLFLAAILTYLYTSSTEDSFRTQTGRAFDELSPSEFLPFKRYVEQCLDDVLLRGLRRAGSQGGFIYPQELGKRFDYINPTESDGVMLFPSGDMFVPYWLYMQGNNECDLLAGGCEKVFLPPPLEGDVPGSIASQLELYIERNVDICLRDREVLEPIGVYYERVSEPKAEVTFTNNDVRVVLDYHFTVDNGNVKSEIKKFAGIVDLPFVEYYENAIFLAALVDQSGVFERGTLALISLYSGMEADKLPPMAGSDSEFISTLFWVNELVKQKLRQILVSNVQLFTVRESRNFKPVEDFYDPEYYTLKQRIYQNFILPGTSKISQYTVNFAYNDWSPYLRLNDDVDGVLRPEALSMDWFPFFGVNRIRTMYSLSYPVVVNINNPDHLSGEGFQFSFASEVNIRNNAPMTSNYTQFDYSVFNDFSPDRTFLCDVDMRTSEPVSFRVINGMTNEPEPEVLMNFVCGDEVCSVGSTDDAGVFNGSLPVCGGGRVQLLKADFESIFLKVNPNIDFAIQLGDIPFEPFRLVNVTASRFLVRKDPSVILWSDLEGDPNPWALQQTAQPIDSREQIIIQLERVRDENVYPLIEKEDFFTFAAFSGDRPITEMQLLPGYYVGKITGVLEAPVDFPPHERCYTSDELEDLSLVLAVPFSLISTALGLDSLFGDDEQCFNVPEQTQTINPYPGGFAEFSNTSLLQFRKADLDGASTIEFREIFIDIPGVPPERRVIEDLTALSNTSELNAQYRGLLTPVYR